jgi:hypothetical protein
VKEPKRRGRKPVLASDKWAWISVRLPDPFGHALRLYCVRKRTKQATLIREMLERLLVQEGYLRVHTSRGPEGEVVAYEAVD